MSDLLSEVLKNSELSELNKDGSQKNLQDLITVFQQEKPSRSIVDLQTAFLSERIELENIHKLQTQIQQAKIKNKELYDKINGIKNQLDNHYDSKKNIGKGNIKKKLNTTQDSNSIKQQKQISKTIKFINRRPNLIIPDVLKKLFGENFDEYEETIHTKIKNIQNLSQKQVYEKSKYLMHELVMQEMHFKKLYKLFYFFNKEEKKVTSTKKYLYNYPSGKIKSNNNLVKTFERKIYQHVGGFCNRGIQMDSNKRKILKDAFKKDKQKKKNNKKLIPNKSLTQTKKRKENFIQKNLPKTPKQKIKSNLKNTVKNKDKKENKNLIEEDDNQEVIFQNEENQNFQPLEQKKNKVKNDLKNKIKEKEDDIKSEQILSDQQNNSEQDSDIQQDKQKNSDLVLSDTKSDDKDKKIQEQNLLESNLTIEYLNQHQDEIHNILDRINKKAKNKLIDDKNKKDDTFNIQSEKFLKNNYKVIHTYLNQLQNDQLKNRNLKNKQSIRNDFNFSLRDTLNFLESYKSLKIQDDNEQDQQNELLKSQQDQQDQQDQDIQSLKQESIISEKQIQKDQNNLQDSINNKDIQDQDKLQDSIDIKDNENLIDSNIKIDSLQQSLQDDKQSIVSDKEDKNKNEQEDEPQQQETEQSWGQIFLTYSNQDKDITKKIFQTKENSLHIDNQQKPMNDSNQSEDNIKPNELVQEDLTQSYEYSGNKYDTKINSLQSIEQKKQQDDIIQEQVQDKGNEDAFKKKNDAINIDNTLNLTNSDQYMNQTFQSKLNSLDQQQLQKIEQNQYDSVRDFKEKIDKGNDDNKEDEEIKQNDVSVKDNNDKQNNLEDGQEDVIPTNAFNKNKIDSHDNDIQQHNNKDQQITQDNMQDDNKDEDENKNKMDDEDTIKDNDNEFKKDDNKDNNKENDEQQNEDDDLDYFNMQNNLDEQLSDLFYEQLKQPLEQSHSITRNLSKNFKISEQQDSNFSTFNPNLNDQNSQQQIYATPFQRGQSFGRKSQPDIEEIIKKKDTNKKITQMKKDLQYSLSKDRFVLDDEYDIYRQQNQQISKFQNSIRNQPIPMSKQNIESLRQLNDIKKKSLQEQLKLSQLDDDQFQMDKIDKDLILISESLSNNQSLAQKKNKQKNSNKQIQDNIQSDKKLTKNYETQSYNENDIDQQDTIVKRFRQIQ